MTTPTHEYRATFTMPLPGSDRAMSKAKSEAGPILDKALAEIAELSSVKALGIEPVLTDTTVRLGAKKAVPQSAEQKATVAEERQATPLHPHKHNATE